MMMFESLERADTTAKFRILHVVFTSGLAGSQRYCIDLANGQAALGHDVHVVSVRNPTICALLSSDVSIHVIATPFFRSMRLRQLIARANIDIVHAHLSPACKALAAVRGNAIKVATLHVGYKSKQHAHMDGVICVNEAQAARVGAYAGHVGRIANWSPAEKPIERFDLRARLALPPGTRIIGAVGRLHPSKGNDVLISAFLRTAPYDAILVIAGDGPQRAELETLSRRDGRIHLLGFCNNVAGFLQNLDLFVSPSREESAGLAILEAMQAGLPIITTATEGPLEYLRDQPVRFVECGSIDELSQALLEVFRRPTDAASARVDYDMRAFSRRAGIAKVLRFYSQAAASRTSEFPAANAALDIG